MIASKNKCGVPSCHCKEKKYGVCGRHKRFYYKNDDIAFQSDIKILNKLCEGLSEEFSILLLKGIEPLNIQKYYSENNKLPNLSRAQQKIASPDFQKSCEILNSFVPTITNLQKIYDPTLVSNNFARINHKTKSRTEPSNCNCQLCMLGT